MAFCTVCGASVAGAFCSKCGTPAAASGASAPAASPPVGAPPMSPPPMGPPPMSGAAAGAAAAPAPVQRKTSPIVWILLVIFGLFALGIVGVIGTGIFLARRGPAYLISKAITASNPNLDVVNTDAGNGTITLRDRRTGKTVTMSFDDAKRGRFRLETEDDNGKRASLELGGSAPVPSWVPTYPGSHPQPLFSAQGESDHDAGEAGSFTFTTSDSASQVNSFYEAEAARLGMHSNSTNTTSVMSVMVLKDSDDQRSLTVSTQTSGSQTTVNVTYARKR